ncbi:MAG: response regulator, partial [Thermoplasmatales archaeon]|nr:response regulator [Thermoplasmatales archaeon]
MVKKILIVDDDSGVNYTVKNGLEGLDADYKVESVESGEECLEFLQNDDIPDLILLDIMMPEMSGWETYN